MISGFVINKTHPFFCESLRDFPDLENFKICFFWKTSDLGKSSWIVLLKHENKSIELRKSIKMYLLFKRKLVCHNVLLLN